ncbi:MAG: glutathione S-transferase N-terminal domain-containing protein [Pseudomonadota bacterium]
MILYGESFSPWTKKARWALEICGHTYTYREYTPTLSEPGLRFKLRQWRGLVSVPVLFADTQIVRGSWDIARFASDRSLTATLGDFGANEAWNVLSEAALAEGRTRVVRGVLANDAALAESLPSFVPDPLRPWLRFVARDAVRRLDRKYANLVRPGSLRIALEKTRDALAAVPGDYLLGDFSYTDISMAVLLEVVAPRAKADPPLGAAMQACWIDERLAAEFADLVAWRDRLAASPATTFSQFHDDAA